MLWYVPIHFDDMDMFSTHRGGSEFLAICEFNDISKYILID